MHQWYLPRSRLLLQAQLLRGSGGADRSMFRLTASLGTLQVALNYEGAGCHTLSQVGDVACCLLGCMDAAVACRSCARDGLRTDTACLASLDRSFAPSARLLASGPRLLIRRHQPVLPLPHSPAEARPHLPLPPPCCRPLWTASHSGWTSGQTPACASSRRWAMCRQAGDQGSGVGGP